jgi:hypothetical protein
MQFKTTILTAGKSATGIEVPAAIIEALGAGKRPPVRVTLGGYTYRSTIAVMGGRYMLGVNASVREAAGVAGGDHLNVAIELDTDPRDVDLPAELAAALAHDPALNAHFDSLSYSKKRSLADPIARGKTPETRQRNLTKALTALRSVS